MKNKIKQFIENFIELFAYYLKHNAWALWAGGGLCHFFNTSLSDLNWWFYIFPLIFLIQLDKYGK